MRSWFDIDLDELPDAAFVIGSDGRIARWNLMAEQLFEWSRQDVLGHPLEQFLQFEDGSWRTEAVTQARAGRIFRGTQKVCVRDRTLFLDWSMNGIAPESRDTATLEIVRDITQRVKREQALNQLFVESPHVVSVIDMTTSQFIQVSRQFCKSQRRDEKEILGKTAEQIGIVPADNALELKTKLLTDGYLEAEEVQTTKADGSISFGLTSARQLDIDGRKCAVTAWQDITKLKRAEAALRAAHKRFDEAMAVIPVVIWWVTFDQGKATDAYISLEVDRILRLPEGTLRNDWDGLMARIHPEDIAHVQHEIALSFQHPGTNHQVEYRLQRADGTSAWIRTSGVGRLGPNGTIHGFGISEDITAQRLAAAEQERLAQQLQQSQKLESLGRLAGGIAHDFNNILTAILGNLDLVTMQLEPGDPRLARLREAHSAGRKAADLTRHLLALSRQKIIEPRVVDLNELVDNASRLLERLLGENIRLRKVLHANLWSVKVDPNQIEQVLINLAVNARDAMPEGGTLTLETSHVQLDKTYCENHPEATVGPHVMLAVSDTGCGMTPEVKASVFEPFFTTKPPGQGTGLGLAMVHGLIRQHGGSIAFYSEPGQGTTFKVYLPALHVKPTSLGLSTHLPTVKGGTETIFLVEDDEGVRRLAGDVLSQLGYRIFSFESVSSALEAASCHNGEIDLLLTDVVLPEHNGRWLADQLLSLFPTMKVLFSSGYTADVIVHHGVLEENIHFLEKPYSTDALAIAVRRILDGEELVRLATAL